MKYFQSVLDFKKWSILINLSETDPLKFMFSLLCENSEDPLACQDNKCPDCQIEKLGEVAEGEDPDEGASDLELRWGLQVPVDAIVSFGFYRRLTVVSKAGVDQKKRSFATEELTFET